MEGENHTTTLIRLIAFNRVYGKSGLFNTLFNTLLTLCLHYWLTQLYGT